ncbi:CBS domain-containing protein [Streptomyces sp. NBC_00083]|uniref:CBS domain-containing protein n=1 Tax=Streptomyces sp. NBC_00083 TaxID=2975647 RepID=UPI00224EA3B6|nr:CBS domain-containing protein [Streptomyces sp. NBC_00083]MCX5383978.1 CBS domain-containing protein [Streptomyces sp. NBC_00083]
MTTARDLMTADVRCVPASETLDRAAQLMRDHGIGALPVKGGDGTLTGIVTDRDIVVKALAAGKDAAEVTAGDLAEGGVHTVDAGADATLAVRAMSEARIRRIVVVEDGTPVGMITEADLARKLTAEAFATYAGRVYASS